eukprot:8888824-Pyramimonas_sp.AAC.1
MAGYGANFPSRVKFRVESAPDSLLGYVGLLEKKPAGARMPPHPSAHRSTCPSVGVRVPQRVTERLFQYVPVERAPEASR